MSDAATLVATFQGKDVNLRSLMQTLRAELVRTDQDATRTGRAIGANVASGAVQGERAALRYAQSLASIQRAQGDLAGATNTYRQALAGLTPNTLEANTATLKLMQSQQALDRSMLGSRSYAQQFGSEMKGQLLGMIGPAAAATAAIAAIGKGVELAQQGAQADQVEKRFHQLAQTAGTTGSALKAALRQASGNEINDLNLELGANRAMMLGVADSAQEFSVLLAIARDRAQALGMSSTQAFNDLVTGLGRGSAEILDNLGLIVSVKEANEAYAASVGKTANELTKAEQKQALINAVLAQGQATLAQSGGTMETQASKMAGVAAAWENALNRIGTALAHAYDAETDRKALDAIANLFPDEATQKAQANAAIIQQSMQQVQLTLQAMATATPEAAAAIGSLTPQIESVGQSSAANAEAVLGLVNSYYAGQISAQELTAQLAQLDAIQQAQSANTLAAADAHDRHTQATQTSSQALAEHAASLQEEAAQSLLSAANSDELTTAKATLEQQARATAAALVAAGDAGAAKAAQLAASSSLVDQLTAAYYRLAAAQAQVAGNARLAAQAAQTRNLAPGGIGYNAPGRKGNSDADIDHVVQLQKEARAQQDVARTTAAATRAVQGNTAARHANTRAAGGSGGGGGRASGKSPRLTQEQRNAQQLIELDRQTAKQRADVERDHQQELADIAEAEAKKRQAAEQRLHETRLQGRAAMYRKLVTMEDQAQAQALSAAYERIEQETQALAQRQGADVAEAYRTKALEAAQTEAEIQAEIAKAQEDGNAAKAANLQAVLRMQQEADQQALQRIKDQGSAIANETAKRYAAEEQAYRDHLDRMTQAYQEKAGQLTPGAVVPPVATAPGQSSQTQGGAARTPASQSTAPAPVQDVTTTKAVQASSSDMVSKLDHMLTKLEQMIGAVREVKTAIQSLKITSPFKA